MIEFHFNEIYAAVFTTDKRIIDIRGGRGRGGSHFGTDYFLFLLTQPQYFRGYFIRKTLKDIKTSLFQDIKDRIYENPGIDINDFHINENNYSLLYKPTGNMIISKGITGSKGRTAKMKSLSGATHVLIEEADQKKFIGNAVEVNMARVLCEALCARLIEEDIKPIFGALKPIESQQRQMEVTQTTNAAEAVEDPDDLPF